MDLGDYHSPRVLLNYLTGFGSRVFDLITKVLICIVYIVRVELDDYKSYQCKGYPCDKNHTLPQDGDNMEFSSSAINWHVLLWVYRPLPLWLVQVSFAVISFSKALLEIFVQSKGTILEHALREEFVMECVCSVPVIVTIFYPPVLKNLFLPTFLSCWLAKIALEHLLHDLHLSRKRFQTISVTLSQQMLILMATLICLIFTTVCGIQHIQRGSSVTPLTMFEAFYFVIVTFSTVGYGDISPDIWLGQVFILLMICVAFIFIPRQIEGLATTWLERCKSGGEYSARRAAGNHHVVVCSSKLSADTIMDFLMEFYAHPKLENYIVVLLSSEEVDRNLHIILKEPKWAHRVIYTRGSALNDVDLKRCRINEADACFVLAPKDEGDKEQADHQTILRSWAVKDYAPRCRQYLQLFKMDNKIHVKFAEHVVCQDEFKYAILANNCLYPGLSTLVTLLLHTTSLSECISLKNSLNWQQIYGRHSSNEVYHVQVNRSQIFESYKNKSFTEASSEAHKNFGVCLVAVLDMTKTEPKLKLNPGPKYKLKGTDYCFYLGEAREEHSRIRNQVLEKVLQQESNKTNLNTKHIEQLSAVLDNWLKTDIDIEEEESVFNNTISGQIGKKIQNYLRKREANNTGTEEELKVVPSDEDMDTIADSHEPANKILMTHMDMGQEDYVMGSPPCTMYVGNRRAKCHKMKKPRPLCCLEWGQNCLHCSYKNANDERWTNQLIMLASQYASSGIINFVLPLRSSFISMNSLSPIVLLLEESPDTVLLETISHFPMVYWMLGKLTSVDDLLRAGINKVSHLVVVNRESKHHSTEKTMADAETIVTVQTISKMFPNVNIITELNHASNIRFMQFRAQCEYSRRVSQLENVNSYHDRVSTTLTHIFRLPFASGQVFSASMLDSLLYQTFVKGYLIMFVRLLLGIDAENNSGHLSSIRVKNMTVATYKTYGELYSGLVSTTGEIPIAIYRTEEAPFPFFSLSAENNNITNRRLGSRQSIPSEAFTGRDTDQNDLSDMIRNRLRSLSMDENDYCAEDDQQDLISYVILNPTPKRHIKLGDIIYVIQPSNMSAIPSKQKWNKLRNMLKLASRQSDDYDFPPSPSSTEERWLKTSSPKLSSKSSHNHENHLLMTNVKPPSPPPSRKLPNEPQKDMLSSPSTESIQSSDTLLNNPLNPPDITPFSNSSSVSSVKTKPKQFNVTFHPHFDNSDSEDSV